MILDGNDPSAIAAAARALRGGALLGLPTETVYGLAADASSDAAVAQIFAAKGRPSDHPLIVHVADASGIAHFASEVPAFAQALVDAFWPGPLTLILPRLSGVATAATCVCAAGGAGACCGTWASAPVVAVPASASTALAMAPRSKGRRVEGTCEVSVCKAFMRAPVGTLPAAPCRPWSHCAGPPVGVPAHCDEPRAGMRQLPCTFASAAVPAVNAMRCAAARAA